MEGHLCSPFVTLSGNNSYGVYCGDENCRKPFKDGFRTKLEAEKWLEKYLNKQEVEQSMTPETQKRLEEIKNRLNAFDPGDAHVITIRDLKDTRFLLDLVGDLQARVKRWEDKEVKRAVDCCGFEQQLAEAKAEIVRLEQVLWKHGLNEKGETI